MSFPISPFHPSISLSITASTAFQLGDIRTAPPLSARIHSIYPHFAARHGQLTTACHRKRLVNANQHSASIVQQVLLSLPFLSQTFPLNSSISPCTFAFATGGYGQCSEFIACSLLSRHHRLASFETVALQSQHGRTVLAHTCGYFLWFYCDCATWIKLNATGSQGL